MVFFQFKVGVEVENRQNGEENRVEGNFIRISRTKNIFYINLIVKIIHFYNFKYLEAELKTYY